MANNPIPSPTVSGGGGTVYESVYQMFTVQFIPNNTWVNLNFDHKVTDTSNSVTTGTDWTWTCPADGTYLATIGFSGDYGAPATPTTCYLWLSFFIDDTTEVYISQIQSNSKVSGELQSYAMSGAFVMSLTTGQTVKPEFRQVNSQALDFGDTGGMVSIKKLN